MNSYQVKIIDQINLKKPEGYKFLYDNYYSSLCSFSSKILYNRSRAEDLVQDVFIRLWKSKGYFPTVKALTAFLYISVKNASLNINRNESKIQNLELSEIEDLNDLKISDKSIVQLIIEEEYYRQVYNVIDKLTPKRKKVLLLSMEGLSYKEIAEKTGISINTVKTLKQNAIKFLKEELEYPILLFVLLSTSKN